MEKLKTFLRDRLKRHPRLERAVRLYVRRRRAQTRRSEHALGRLVAVDHVRKRRDRPADDIVEQAVSFRRDA